MKKQYIIITVISIYLSLVLLLIYMNNSSFKIIKTKSIETFSISGQKTTTKKTMSSNRIQEMTQLTNIFMNHRDSLLKEKDVFTDLKSISEYCVKLSGGLTKDELIYCLASSYCIDNNLNDMSYLQETIENINHNIKILPIIFNDYNKRYKEIINYIKSAIDKSKHDKTKYKIIDGSYCTKLFSDRVIESTNKKTGLIKKNPVPIHEPLKCVYDSSDSSFKCPTDGVGMQLSDSNLNENFRGNISVVDTGIKGTPISFGVNTHSFDGMIGKIIDSAGGRKGALGNRGVYVQRTTGWNATGKDPPDSKYCGIYNYSDINTASKNEHIRTNYNYKTQKCINDKKNTLTIDQECLGTTMGHGSQFFNTGEVKELLSDENKKCFTQYGQTEISNYKPNDLHNLSRCETVRSSFDVENNNSPYRLTDQQTGKVRNIQDNNNTQYEMRCATCEEGKQIPMKTYMCSIDDVNYLKSHSTDIFNERKQIITIPKNMNDYYIEVTVNTRFETNYNDENGVIGINNLLKNNPSSVVVDQLVTVDGQSNYYNGYLLFSHLEDNPKGSGTTNLVYLHIAIDNANAQNIIAKGLNSIKGKNIHINHLKGQIIYINNYTPGSDFAFAPNLKDWKQQGGSNFDTKYKYYTLRVRIEKSNGIYFQKMIEKFNIYPPNHNGLGTGYNMKDGIKINEIKDFDYDAIPITIIMGLKPMDVKKSEFENILNNSNNLIIDFVRYTDLKILPNSNPSLSDGGVYYNVYQKNEIHPHRKSTNNNNNTVNDIKFYIPYNTYDELNYIQTKIKNSNLKNKYAHFNQKYNKQYELNNGLEYKSIINIIFFEGIDNISVLNLYEKKENTLRECCIDSYVKISQEYNKECKKIEPLIKKKLEKEYKDINVIEHLYDYLDVDEIKTSDNPGIYHRPDPICKKLFNNEKTFGIIDSSHLNTDYHMCPLVIGENLKWGTTKQFDKTIDGVEKLLTLFNVRMDRAVGLDNKPTNKGINIGITDQELIAKLTNKSGTFFRLLVTVDNNHIDDVYYGNYHDIMKNKLVQILVKLKDFKSSPTEFRNNNITVSDIQIIAKKQKNKDVYEFVIYLDHGKLNNNDTQNLNSNLKSLFIKDTDVGIGKSSVLADSQIESSIWRQNEITSNELKNNMKIARTLMGMVFTMVVEEAVFFPFLILGALSKVKKFKQVADSKSIVPSTSDFAKTIEESTILTRNYKSTVNVTKIIDEIPPGFSKKSLKTTKLNPNSLFSKTDAAKCTL